MALRSARAGTRPRDAVHHPVFARYYARASVGAETRMGLARIRERLLGGLSGRVLEIGAGNGLNFAHYPGTVSEVVAIEPGGAWALVRGERWQVRADAPLAVGQRVRVLAVRGLMLDVAADPESAMHPIPTSNERPT